MRLSKTQKGILFVLYAIEVKQQQRQPVLAVNLLRMINSTREKLVEGSNFRIGAHKLTDNGLTRQYRTHSLKLGFILTEAGREIAEALTEKDCN